MRLLWQRGAVAAEAKQSKKWAPIMKSAESHGWEHTIAKWRKEKKLKKLIWNYG